VIAINLLSRFMHSMRGNYSARRIAIVLCALSFSLPAPAQTDNNAASASAAAPAENNTSQRMLDRIIAIVDDDVILASELDDAVARATVNYTRAKRELPPADQFRRQIFDQLVLNSLQLQIAKRAGVRVSDSELNDQMEQIARQNNMTLEQFSQALTKDGTPYAVVREQLRKEILIKHVQQGSVSERIQITDQEVDNFLNSAEGRQITAPQYHVQHALLPFGEGADAAAVQHFAEQLTARLRAGEDFQRVVSTAGPVKIQSNDLGWKNSDELPTLVANLVPNLKAGETADPQRTAGGYHIIKLAEVRGKGEVVEQTKARHILLKPSAIRSDDQCKQLAAQLRQRALNGEDFAALARQYSEDIGSAMEGGELGWTSPGQLVAAFQSAMDGTKVGQISEPFHSRYGWHIVLVEERRKQDVTEEVRRNIARNYLHEKKYQEELDNWLRKIRDGAFVDIKKV
jgi:peptidyl-prolyl cis-trans isomerase SurA